MKLDAKQAKVDEIVLKSKIKAKKRTIVELKGKLGNTGWQFSEKITIDKNLNRVGIALTITRKGNVVGLDVISNFSREIEVVFPHKGIWKISCNNVEIEAKVR